MQEHTLSGGNATDRVLHVGETVRKPWTAATPSVTAFVRAVLAAGVDVPQPLGKDEDGRSVQEFVHGTRAMDLAPMALDDLTRVGSIVRAIHDASAEFIPPENATYPSCSSKCAAIRSIIAVVSWRGVRYLASVDRSSPGDRTWPISRCRCAG